MAEVKFCGLTRGQDAEEGVRAGAAYLGVIFAGGPRLVDPENAVSILAKVPRRILRVGVFGDGAAAAIADRAREAGVDIVQLHADPDAAAVWAMRAAFGGPVWAALRVTGSTLPPRAGELFSVADAVVLDARAEHALGGTGLTLDWNGLIAPLAGVRGQARLVLAGGLTPANVARAVIALQPDIVDVSSGVETLPGIKDHSLMRAFMSAVRATTRAA
jgi:phosphoribosylanthranilate isomerase